MKQKIISIGREFGSAGHEIAEWLAKRYGLAMYDQNLLEEVASRRNLDSRELEEFDELKRNKLLYRSHNGMSSSPAENVAKLQFAFLREKAEAGESFVVVGRCAETVLCDFDCLITFFITGDPDKKAARIMKYYNKTEKEAAAMMRDMDKQRKQYHDSHCKTKWGDTRNYDLSINSSRLGLEKSVELLVSYIDARTEE